MASIRVSCSGNVCALLHCLLITLITTGNYILLEFPESSWRLQCQSWITPSLDDGEAQWHLVVCACVRVCARVGVCVSMCAWWEKGKNTSRRGNGDGREHSPPYHLVRKPRGSAAAREASPATCIPNKCPGMLKLLSPGDPIYWINPFPVGSKYWPGEAFKILKSVKQKVHVKLNSIFIDFLSQNTKNVFITKNISIYFSILLYTTCKNTLMVCTLFNTKRRYICPIYHNPNIFRLLPVVSVSFNLFHSSWMYFSWWLFMYL